ncbi:hypothetical protein OG423_14320 [Micromonospora zamorensis]|uniref:hypothetical protein n=1 Tax=Micromonospora zamorensis TaxID=709883 RepID=UPI00352BCD1B|nr:hypothetical protein OG423_14320 [Micromonospora zamorensis]
MSTAIRASGFDNFRVALKNATAEQLTVTQAYWAALPGVIAEQHRHLVDEEFEVRQAVARLNQITTGADR